MDKLRVANLVVALTIVLTSLAAAPVAAAETRVKGTYKEGPWRTLGAWGDRADFFATWTVKSNSNGTTTISKLEMVPVMRHGKTCSSWYCVDWWTEAKAVFKDGSGKVLKRVYPPRASCGYAYAFGGQAKWWRHCKSASFTLPASLSKVKFVWAIHVKRPDGFAQVWKASKTVTAY